MNPSWIHQSTQGEKCDFHLASKSMTDVIDFGDTSLCRAETLIQSEFPEEISLALAVIYGHACMDARLQGCRW